MTQIQIQNKVIIYMYLSLRHKTEYRYYTLDSYLWGCHKKGQTGQLWGWYCPPGLTINRKVFLRKKLSKKKSCLWKPVSCPPADDINKIPGPSLSREKQHVSTKLRLEAMQLECLNKKILIKCRWKEDGCPYQRTINSWKFLRSLCNFLLKFKSWILVIF